MSVQLDLFIHSRGVILANRAIDAIVARDAADAAGSVAELRAEAPDHPALPRLETLAAALLEWGQRAGDASRIIPVAVWLEQEIAPVARQVLGLQADLLLAAFFRDLARTARGLGYEPAKAKAHRAWLCLRCGDWSEAEQAALAVPGANEIPEVLHWLAVARHRQRGLAAARPALFALAWREPQRLASVVAELDDSVLTRDFELFDRACEWESVEAAELSAWFPAWYLLEHPAASKDVAGAEAPATPAAMAAQLLTHIIEVERQADWQALIALRKQLRVLSPDLFSLYMARQAAGDWRWQTGEG
ncbi:MAG TPA: hypothetical protein VF814_20885 [Casimicrobiaceae bacterium]